MDGADKVVYLFTLNDTNHCEYSLSGREGILSNEYNWKRVLSYKDSDKLPCFDVVCEGNKPYYYEDERTSHLTS